MHFYDYNFRLWLLYRCCLFKKSENYLMFSEYSTVLNPFKFSVRLESFISIECGLKVGLSLE